MSAMPAIGDLRGSTTMNLTPRSRASMILRALGVPAWSGLLLHTSRHLVFMRSGPLICP